MLRLTRFHFIILAAACAAMFLSTNVPARQLLGQGQNLGSRRTVTVTDDDNEEEVNLSPGGTLVVRLASSASTGYSWSVAQNNASLLKPLDDKYVRSNSKLMGAPGNQVFRFKAVGSGGTELILLYQNPSMGGVQAAKKFRVIVTINRPR